MNLDSIIGYIIVPLIFLWLGARIYSHEQEQIDALIAKVKGWFVKDEGSDDGGLFTQEEYSIGYR